MVSKYKAVRARHVRLVTYQYFLNSDEDPFPVISIQLKYRSGSQQHDSYQTLLEVRRMGLQVADDKLCQDKETRELVADQCFCHLGLTVEA